MPVPHDYDAEIKALQDEVAALQKQLEEQKQNAPYIGDNGDWYVNGEDTHVRAQGPKGDDGKDASKDPWNKPKWTPGALNASTTIMNVSATGLYISFTVLSFTTTCLSLATNGLNVANAGSKHEFQGFWSALLGSLTCGLGTLIHMGAVHKHNNGVKTTGEGTNWDMPIMGMTT